MKELLQLEKQRRGLSKDKLVFLGMADIANYHWCAMKSLLRNREMELAFFQAYLHDRLLYSSRLGLINEMPTNTDELLSIGNKITFNKIEELLREKAKKQIVVGAFADANILVQAIEKFQSLEGLPPKFRGSFLEIRKAERYPTIRWNFDWENYVVVGVPDGITDTFVYEFKTTKSRFLMHYVNSVALTQADLYGYFFKRNKKRVQIYIMRDDVTETWEEKVDKANAMETLYHFKSVDEGNEPLPPKKWKCKSCKFNKICNISQK